MRVARIDAGVRLVGRCGIGVARRRVGGIGRRGVGRVIVIVAATGDDGGGERQNRHKGKGEEN